MQPVRRWWLILVGVGLLLPVMSWPGTGIAGEAQETAQAVKFCWPWKIYGTPQLSMALGLEIDLVGKNANANYPPVVSLIYDF